MNIKQIQEMMKQAQNIQNKVSDIQAEVDKKEFSTSSGGGALSVVMMGNKKVKEIKISEDMLDKDEKETLEDMLLMSINQLIDEIEAYSKEQLEPITKGLPI